MKQSNREKKWEDIRNRLYGEIKPAQVPKYTAQEVANIEVIDVVVGILIGILFTTLFFVL